MRLRTKILLLLTPLIVVPLLAMGALAYQELKRTSAEQTFGQMRSRLAQLTHTARATLRTAHANARLFATDTLVERYLLTEDTAQRYGLMHMPLLRLFKAFQQAYPEYYEIRILLPDGSEDARWTSVPGRNVTTDESVQPLFQRMTAAPAEPGDAVLPNPDSGESALYVWEPLILRGDPVIEEPVLRGYLVLTIDLAPLATELATVRFGSEGTAFATDARGEPLFATAGGRFRADMSPGLFAKLQRSARNGSLLRADVEGNPHYFYGAVPLPDTYVFATLPRDDLLRSVERLRAAFVPLITVAIAVTLGLVFLALNRLVVGPIKKLDEAAAEIGRGNLEVDLVRSSADEIGDLSRAFQDMSRSLKDSQEQIRLLAFHDGLTGLPNRRMFNECLSHLLTRAKRRDERFAILFLDIDNFKRINDTLGHQTADRLLQELSNLLGEVIRKEDLVSQFPGHWAENMLSRLGGDEFVILLPNIKDHFSPGAVARRILRRLSEPLGTAGHELFITASLGIATYPDDGDTVEALVRCADTAMYHAKEQGKNNYQYYSKSMNVAAVRRLTIENKLRKAIDREELEVHFQPQFDCRTRQIIGAEALLRWRESDNGYISPGIFIPLAEETGLIVPIGEWVLNQTCIHAKEWEAAGLKRVPLSVNVSGVQFCRQNVRDLVARTLVISGLDPTRLGIEITETAVMSVESRAVELLEELHELGVCISLDDFGTGYSSMSYLRRFPITNLKIDRSFIREMLSDRHTSSITTAIIAMAHVLGLRVIAEGVEEQEQFEYLRALNCDAIQGYYLSRPVPPAKLAEMLAEDERRLRAVHAAHADAARAEAARVDGDPVVLDPDMPAGRSRAG